MNDKMRDDFDSWIEQQGMSTMKDGETYYHHATHAAWLSWQASREALAKEIADNMAAINPVAQRLAVRAGTPWVKP